MSLEKSHILVVDDNEEDRAWVIGALRKEGAIPHVAKTRLEAVGKLVELFANKIIPRALICDWMLNPPGSDEYEFYEHLQKHRENTAEPLISNVRRYDQHIAVLVYTGPDVTVPLDVVQKLEFQVIDKQSAAESLVDALLRDPRMEDMRYQARKTVEGEFDDSGAFQIARDETPAGGLAAS